MSQMELFPAGAAHGVFAALHADLVDENGPRISTMRNYRFAIVQYDPPREYEVRVALQRLTGMALS